MPEPRGKNVEMEIEFHFEDKDELPEKIVIGAGGLALKPQFTDLMYQACRMLKEDFLR
jgi:hypothetical protein